MFVSVCALLFFLLNSSVTALNFRMLRQLTGVYVDSDARYIHGSSRLFIPESLDDALVWIYSDNVTLAPNVTAKQPMFIDNKFVVRYYYFLLSEEDVDNETVDTWNNVFQKVESHTCLKFLKTHQDVDSKIFRPGITLHVQDDTCSTVRQGRLRGPTIIRIGACPAEDDYLHELLHVLGFEHEHNRPDRDNFLNIHWDNIKPGLELQYKKSTLNPNLGLDIYDEKYYYDYYSIMHYPGSSYALNKSLPAMSAKCKNIQLDARVKLSTLDIKKLNFYYNCDRFKFLIPAYKDNPAYWFYTDNNTFGFRGSNDDFVI